MLNTEEEAIIHSQYSKPMSSTEVILERSDIAIADKKDILTQEGGIILRNCERTMEWREKVKFINQLISSMKAGRQRTVYENDSKQDSRKI